MRKRGLIGTAAGLAGTVLAADARDRRRIARDPAADRLFTAPVGTQRTVTGAGGVPINVETYGPEDAPPVVLAHGWTCALRFWRLQVHDLMADHHVIAYDQRGHGRSGAPDDGDWSLATIGQDLHAVLDACAGDRKALIAGHSLGAMTIAAWAEQYPDEVADRAAAAALVNTGLGDLISESLLIRTPDAMGAVRQAIGGAVLMAPAPLPPRPDPITHRAIKAIAMSKTASPAEVRFCEDMVLKCKPRVRAGCGRELRAMDLREAAASISVPTLVIAGGADLLTPIVHARQMEDVLPHGLGTLELEGSGHMGPVERGPEVNAALRELSRNYLSNAAAAPAAR
jgi:pimeloyl-ACP methyl ester carboxylesterase